MKHPQISRACYWPVWAACDVIMWVMINLLERRLCGFCPYIDIGKKQQRNMHWSMMQFYFKITKMVLLQYNVFCFAIIDRFKCQSVSIWYVFGRIVAMPTSVQTSFLPVRASRTPLRGHFPSGMMWLHHRSKRARGSSLLPMATA